MWRSRHIYPLVLSAQLFPSLSPFSENKQEKQQKKGKEREGMCQDTAVFSAVSQMIVVLARSPGGSPCDDSAQGRGGNKQRGVRL